MTVFSKTVSFNDLVPLLPALELPDTLKMLFSYRNFVHALAGAVVSKSPITLTYYSVRGLLAIWLFCGYRDVMSLWKIK